MLCGRSEVSAPLQVRRRRRFENRQDRKKRKIKERGLFKCDATPCPACHDDSMLSPFLVA